MIRLTVPTLDEDDFDAVRQVLESGYLVQGEKVEEFEKLVASTVGCAEAVATTSGTAALFLALGVLETKPGQKIAVTSYSWPATSNVIELHEAEPIFIDIDPRTFNLDTSLLARAIEEHEIAGIIPVHTFGQMADMKTIVRLANEAGAWVVEDSACALGAKRDGKPAGSYGDLGCFSFHPRKAITTGEGGMITTNNRALAQKLRVLRNHGLSREQNKAEFTLPAHNFRMTDIQGALGVTQMRKLPGVLHARQEAAKVYDSLFEGSRVQIPFVCENSNPVFQTYVVLLPSSALRDHAILQLKSDGIESTIGTYHLPLTAYQMGKRSYRPGDFPSADTVFGRGLSLPLYAGITVEEQRYVSEKLLAVLRD